MLYFSGLLNTVAQQPEQHYKRQYKQAEGKPFGCPAFSFCQKFEVLRHVVKVERGRRGFQVSAVAKRGKTRGKTGQ
jgi:hypothetical protein